MLKEFLQADIKSVNKEEGTFEVIASCGKTDRLGDVIDPKGWYLTNYKKNPVILWSHSTGGFITPAIPPVARADKVWVEDEKELKIKGHFADTHFAQELRILVEGGFLNAVSVGFLPLVEEEKGDIEIESKMYRRVTDLEIKSYIEKGSVEINNKLYERDGEHFTKQELLELSWVSVPALPQALVSARKMNLSLVTKALESEIEGIKGSLSGDLICSGKIKEDMMALLISRDIPFENEGDYISIKPEEKEMDVFEKPYPNEHSCRLESPDKYKRFRRQNCQRKHDGKCIDVIWGITKGEDEKTEQQALRYDKKIWTESDAKNHCKGEKGTFEPASKKELTAEQFDKIRDFISETEGAISVLKELLPESGATPVDDTKGRKPFVKQKSKKSDMERLLIMFDKMCEALLRKLRQ